MKQINRGRFFFYAVLALPLWVYLGEEQAVAGKTMAGQIMSFEEIEVYKQSLIASLNSVFEDDLPAVKDQKEHLRQLTESLDGCYYDGESFIRVKKLWSESCSETIELSVARSMPYGLMKKVAVEDSRLKDDPSLLPLLKEIYSEESVAAADEQSRFVNEDFIPQLQSCYYELEDPGEEAFSCRALFEAAKTEGFAYFQMEEAVSASVSKLKAARKRESEDQKAAAEEKPVAEESRKIVKP